MMSPKAMAAIVGVVGLILVIGGFMSQAEAKSSTGEKCDATFWSWLPIIIGFVMLGAGMMMGMKAKKAAAGGAAALAAPESPSISPEPSSESMPGM